MLEITSNKYVLTYKCMHMGVKNVNTSVSNVSGKVHTHFSKKKRKVRTRWLRAHKHYYFISMISYENYHLQGTYRFLTIRTNFRGPFLDKIAGE